MAENPRPDIEPSVWKTTVMVLPFDFNGAGGVVPHTMAMPGDIGKIPFFTCRTQRLYSWCSYLVEIEKVGII